MKRALVTGIAGQDGSYLAELLLSKGYEVHGIIRRASTFNTKRIDHIYPNQPSTRLFQHHGDLSSTEWVLNLVYSFAPDELYHLAAQSHVLEFRYAGIHGRHHGALSTFSPEE